MPHPLEQKLVLIRARVRRLVAVYGLSWLVAVTLATVLMLGLADYVFRFEDRGLRVLAWLAMLSAFGWTAYRHLYVPLAVRLGDVEIARRIERRFPQFHDGLASAVQFVRQPEDDPTAGSVALRRAVVARVAAEAEGLDFGQVIEPRPVWRALAAAAVAVLLAASLALWDPGSARTALTRLANPLSDVTWPQLYHLMVRNPVDRIARGGDFEVIVVDRYRRKLPREVYIHYRFENPDGTVAEETRPMRFTGEAMVDRREQVTRSFSYRAEGGDDHSMGWHRVEVLDPPAVDRITVTVRPPEYTGWPPVRSDGPIRALAGSGVEIEARTTKPLRSATLCLEDGRRLAAAVSEDGYQFRSPPPGGETLVLDQSGAYWFELIDRDGLPGGRQRWPIHAVPDSPPTVRIDSPTANLFVTPQATVQVVVAANDDLALRRIVLRAARGDQVEDSAHAIQLFAGPEGPPARPSGLGAQRTEPDRRVVNYAWDLTPFDLQPGDRVTFVATATDYRPQSADSAPRRLVVITPEELADHIAARQSAVLSELARALEIQRQSRSRVAGAEIRLDETGRLDQLDVDRLQGAELSQRQVTRILTSPSDGVPMHIRGLLADLENNHLESPDVQRQMHELLATIEALKKEHLTTIAHRLTSVIKAAQILLDGSTGEPETEPGQQQRPARPDPTVARPLAAAGQHQDAVIATLEELLGQLSRWADYRRFHRHLSQLLREQEAVSDRTTQLARSTLAQEVDDLPPHQVAELRTAARDQRELARRLDRILQEMSQAVEKIRDVDPLAADNIADAVYEARQQAVSAQMQSAGSHVAANRMGQAMRLQETVREGLRQMLDILANRRETELERLVEKLREAEDQLAELAGREEKLRGQAEAAADQADEQARRRKLEELRGEQERLREETERMARQLERLMADRASRTTA
ncbi:MAG TPA: hypothetical protein EYH34_06185, partial [Planctomycetes bacterium]|nr:hypothetical protein [Planctomycetota bacterium]